jgi:intracellular multiplication protein IcmC
MPLPSSNLNPSDPGNVSFLTFLQNILNEDLTPILHIVTTVSYFIGICLILGGLTRLYRHGHGGHHHHRVTPMGTSMYFVVGIVLISFMPYLQMLSNAFVQLNMQDALMTQCTSSMPLDDSGFYTGSNSFCPMMAYATDISNAVSDSDAVSEGIEYLVFGLMFLVGVIAFIRGMLLLIKIGEGSHQGGGIGKAFTFIFSGIVAVNLPAVYDLFNNMLTSNTGT